MLLDSINFRTTKFTDCENYQVTCHTKDSNNSCHNSDVCPNSFGIDDGDDDGGVWDNNLKQKGSTKHEYYETNSKAMLLPDNKRSTTRSTRQP